MLGLEHARIWRDPIGTPVSLLSCPPSSGASHVPAKLAPYPHFPGTGPPLSPHLRGKDPTTPPGGGDCHPSEKISSAAGTRDARRTPCLWLH